MTETPPHVFRRIAEDINKRWHTHYDEHQMEGIIDGSYVSLHGFPVPSELNRAIRAEALSYGLELDAKATS